MDPMFNNMGPCLPMAPMTRDDGDDVSGGGDRVREDTDLERIRAYQVSTNNGSINTKKGHNTKRPPRANSKNLF